MISELIQAVNFKQWLFGLGMLALGALVQDTRVELSALREDVTTEQIGTGVSKEALLSVIGRIDRLESAQESRFNRMEIMLDKNNDKLDALYNYLSPRRNSGSR